MTPSFSMLLPARNRPKNLLASVDSVLDLASDPDRVEVLVRLDSCDPSLGQEMDILASYGSRVRTTVEKRRGYAQMHGYYNDLAVEATGDWLFFWNDDIEMKTSRWDDVLREAPSFSIQFPRRDITTTTDFTLPVVGRPIYDALGHLSMNAYCDAWIADYSAYAGTSVIRDDVVFTHHRLNDDTLRGQQDGNAEWLKFSDFEQRALRLADRDAVVAAQGHASRFDGWDVDGVHSTVDYLNIGSPARPTAFILKGRK